MSDTPPDDDPLIGEDDDLDEDDDPEVGEDEQPQASTDTVEQCPFCERTAAGPLRFAIIGRHVKTNHPEEFDAWSATRPNSRVSRTAAKQAGGRPRGRRPSAARASSGSRTDAQPRTTSGPLREVRENVELFYNMSGAVLGMRDPQCGDAIRSVAKNAANEWANLAKTNEAIRKFWSGGGQAVPWLGLFMAHLPIVISVRDHHITPRLEARQAAREAAMMYGDDGTGDLSGQGETGVYITGREDVDLGLVDEADPGDDQPFAVVDVRGGLDVEPTPFTESAVG